RSPPGPGSPPGTGWPPSAAVPAASAAAMAGCVARSSGHAPVPSGPLTRTPVARKRMPPRHDNRCGKRRESVLAVVARDREAVAAPPHGLDRLERAFRVELLAQAPDEDLEHVGIAVEVLLVDVLSQVGLRDHIAGVHHQVLEYFVLVAGQVDVPAMDADRLRCKVEGDRAALEHRLAPAGGTPHQGVDPREQLLDVERLDQVV